MFIAVHFRDQFLCVMCIQLPKVRSVLHKVYKNKINSIHSILKKTETM